MTHLHELFYSNQVTVQITFSVNGKHKKDQEKSMILNFKDPRFCICMVREIQEQIFIHCFDDNSNGIAWQPISFC